MSQKIYRLMLQAEAIALDAEHRFWKELISVGKWVNAAEGFTLEVDAARLALWKKNFDAMKEAGISVPVPFGHSYDPRDNAGFVEALEVRGESLWGLLNIPKDTDAEKLGSTVLSVSVSINPSFIDGTGREWGEVLEHVALTNHPVVTEQGAFLQASRGGAASVELSLVHPAREGESQDASLAARVAELEGEKAEREVSDALRLGKFTKPAADALRQLFKTSASYKLSQDAVAPGLAALARTIIASTPEGAAVDMRERTRLRVMPEPSGAMDESRAKQLARENVALAKLGV